MIITTKDRISGAVKMVERLFASSVAGEREGRLPCAVVCSAIADAFSGKTASRKAHDIVSARVYIRGDILHAGIADVDAESIKSIINDAGLWSVNCWGNKHEC